MVDLNEIETLLSEEHSDKNRVSKRITRRFLPPAWRGSFGPTMSGAYSPCRRHLALSLAAWLTNAPALPVSGFETTVDFPDEIRVQIALKALEAAN